MGSVRNVGVRCQMVEVVMFQWTDLGLTFCLYRKTIGKTTNQAQESMDSKSTGFLLLQS